MSIKKIIQVLRYKYSVFCTKRYLNKNLNIERQYLFAFNGAVETLRDTSKLENRIRICVHGIEKGFSHRSVRSAFGVDKVSNLLQLLNIYFDLDGADKHFVEECLSTVKFYLDQFETNEKTRDVRAVFVKLVNKIGVNVESRRATLNIHKSEIEKTLLDINYEEFVSSRHSCRFFSRTPVNRLLLEKAFRIAEHTPTACNRQAQRVYVFRGEDKQRLLNISPSRSFVDEIDTAILITVDMKAYFSDEAYQCYVDGGLYAMSLLNAIHSTGLGTIPLTASVFAIAKRKELSESFNIPLNEAPIICIGVGNCEDNYYVNASYRKPFMEYVHWVN